MSEKDLIKFSNRKVSQTSSDYPVTRAKSFKVHTSQPDFPQYVKTVQAYARAGMPFVHIANAGDFLGDNVERNEVDASLQQGWQNKVGEVAETEDKILAWQTRGERVLTTHQLLAPVPVTGKEMVTVSKDVTVGKIAQGTTLDVLEGIGVLRKEASRLENNPYLQAIPREFKKAA